MRTCSLSKLKFKPVAGLFLLALLILIHGCTSEKQEVINQSSLVCGDLFSEYAQKPANLEFMNCTNVTGQQTLLKAEYFVSNKNADDVESLLVKNYGLVDVCNYYHSMPLNQVNLQPEKLLKLDSYYFLVINVTHKDFEMLVHEGCKRKRNKEFFVTVSILNV